MVDFYGRVYVENYGQFCVAWNDPYYDGWFIHIV